MNDVADDRVSTWVRLVLVIPLAAPQLLVGIWALLAPHHWYDNFPGVGPHLIAAEPPFNQHLTTDVGAGFLATGVALVVAAVLARRSGVYVALAAYASFAIPHFLYHATHESPGLTSGQNLMNVALLSSGLVWLAVAVWGTRRRPTPASVTA